MRAPNLILATVALAALSAGCSGSSTTERTATTTTTVALRPTGSTSSSAGARCAAAPLPSLVTDVHEASADVDGDGAADDASSYRLGDENWHLHADLARGGAVATRMPTQPGGTVIVLGGADVDGDGAEELWARTGMGASAVILGFARLIDCQLVPVTWANGELAELAVGGSVGTASGAGCTTSSGTHEVATYTATNVGDDQYEVRTTTYRLSGSVLDEQRTSTTQVARSDPAFDRATHFTCGPLAL